MNVVAAASTGDAVEHKEKAGRFLYWWLLLAVFFEYARPATNTGFCSPFR
jgi:hypothetical protein